MTLFGVETHSDAVQALADRLLKPVMIAERMINDFVMWLGFDAVPPDQRPKAGREQRIIFTRPPAAEDWKIEEILRRQRLLGTGGSVLDLGAAPGGFLQVLADVVGIDRHLWFEPAYTSISRVKASRRGPRSVGTINEHAHLFAVREH